MPKTFSNFIAAYLFISSIPLMIFLICTIFFGNNVREQNYTFSAIKRNCTVIGYTEFQHEEYSNSPYCEVNAELLCDTVKIGRKLSCNVYNCTSFSEKLKDCENQMPINSTSVYWFFKKGHMTDYEYSLLYKRTVNSKHVPLLICSTTCLGLIVLTPFVWYVIELIIEKKLYYNVV